LQPSDSVADFMNLLNDMDLRALRDETPRKFLRALEKLNKITL
jgi:hypothetical protein